MNLEAIVKAHVKDPSCKINILNWWRSLGRGNCLQGFFRRNIANDKIYETCPNLTKMLNAFAVGINSAPAGLDPLRVYSHAVNRHDCLVSSGPLLGRPSRFLVRLISPSSAFRFLTDWRFRGSLPTTKSGRYHIKHLLAWMVDLNDEKSYRKKLYSEAEIRGPVKCAFWAFETDIKKKIKLSTLGAKNMKLLTDLIGITVTIGGLGIILRLQSRKVAEMRIPTAWDAIANRYFSPQADTSKYGWTQNLSTKEKGVRETVTPPVRVEITDPPLLIM